MNWRTATPDHLAQLVTDGLTNRQIAAHLGAPNAEAVEKKLRRLNIRRDPRTALANIHRGNVGPDAVDTQAAAFGDTPVSVEQVAERWQLDLTVWEPVEVVPNVWMIGAKHPETGEILTRPLYQTKVRFKRKASATLEALADTLVAAMRAESKRRRRVTWKRAVLPPGEPCALEVALFDLHIGKYAWGEETGNNYDTDRAERIATAAVTDLLAQVPKGCAVEEIILPLGNDFFHYDNPQGQTTAGTPQDRDTRYQRMFRVGWHLASWMIERCAEIAPVKVIVIPGNHDTATTFCLGVVLEAEFAHDPRVTFDNSPKKRKYYRYGQTFLGYAHGHEEKPAYYASLMPVEEAGEWAQSTYREFHLGHFHTGKVQEPIIVEDKTGVTLRWMRSIAGTDSWHAGKGFLNMRSAEAFLWRKSGGLRAHFVSRPVDELTAA